jgi:hypothetical protein
MHLSVAGENDSGKLTCVKTLKITNEMLTFLAPLPMVSLSQFSWYSITLAAKVKQKARKLMYIAWLRVKMEDIN